MPPRSATENSQKCSTRSGPLEVSHQKCPRRDRDLGRTLPITPERISRGRKQNSTWMCQALPGNAWARTHALITNCDSQGNSVGYIFFTPNCIPRVIRITWTQRTTWAQPQWSTYKNCITSESIALHHTSQQCIALHFIALRQNEPHEEGTIELPGCTKVCLAKPCQENTC